MKVLELFSGTKSVGKICNKLGWEVVSLDLKDADINTDILKWDYKKEYEPKTFNIIWASPPCDTFSNLRLSWIGRRLKRHNGKVFTKELFLEDMNNIGLPILRKTQEIINYFQPKIFFIENPQTGNMKKFLNYPFYDVDYCRYSDWGYKKRTRIWTNLKGFEPKLCNNICNNRLPNSLKHIENIGGSKLVKIDGEYKRVKNAKDNRKYKACENLQRITSTKREKYRIPPLLIEELFQKILDDNTNV